MSSSVFFVDGVPVAMPPPDGYVVNFANPARTYTTVSYYFAGFGLFFSFLFLLQRLYVKLKIQNSFGVDDISVLLAWAMSIVEQGFILHSFTNKLIGVHIWEQPLPAFLKFVWEAEYMFPILYAPCQLFSKLALVLFFQKLIPQLWYKYVVWATMLVVIGANTGVFFSAVFVCTPIEMGWDPTITDGHCIDRIALFQATAILGVFMDVCLILLPLPMVAKLQIPRPQKIGLIAIFTIGSATVVTSIIRLVVLIKQLTAIDLPWTAASAAFWVVIEANLNVICACMPTLRAFFLKVAPHVIGIRSSQANTKNAASNPSQNIRTTGGTAPGRKYYHRFDDEEYGMETLVQHEDKYNAKNENWNPPRGDDDDSAKGIIQTKTMTVTYS